MPRWPRCSSVWPLRTGCRAPLDSPSSLFLRSPSTRSVWPPPAWSWPLPGWRCDSSSDGARHDSHLPAAPASRVHRAAVRRGPARRPGRRSRRIRAHRFRGRARPPPWPRCAGRAGPRLRPGSTTRCASCGRTTSPGPGWRSSASPTALPGFDATAGRLLANQADIGDAIKPFYGAAAGNELTSLLRDHISIAVQLLQAAKAADNAAFASAKAAWYRNADDIADFLAAANPRSWPQAVMRAAMTDAPRPDPRRGSPRAERPVRRQRRRLRQDPPPHPRHGRPAQRGHHPRLPPTLPLTPATARSRASPA